MNNYSINTRNIEPGRYIFRVVATTLSNETEAIYSPSTFMRNFEELKLRREGWLNRLKDCGYTGFGEVRLTRDNDEHNTSLKSLEELNGEFILEL